MSLLDKALALAQVRTLALALLSKAPAPPRKALVLARPRMALVKAMAQEPFCKASVQVSALLYTA